MRCRLAPALRHTRATAGDGRVHVIDSGDAKLRARYAAAMAARRAAVARGRQFLFRRIDDVQHDEFTACGQSPQRGATLCLITDLHHLDDTHRAALWRLSTRCELIVLHIVDPAEEELPAAGRVRLTAGDGRGHVIDSGDAKLRARYAAAMAERRAAVARVCLSAGASLHRIHTHRDVFEQIEAVL